MDLRESYHEWFVKHTTWNPDDDETFFFSPYYHDYKKKDSENEIRAYIQQRRCLGGDAGSCYSDYKCPVSASAEEPWDEFYAVVESMNPNLTFMKFHRKIVPLIETSETGESDWYGGYISYETKKVDLYTLWCAIYEE